MKLVLFQKSPDSAIVPGLLTDRGVIDISTVAPKSYTPQLVMQDIIDDFDKLRPAFEQRGKEGEAVPLNRVRLRPPLPRPGKILA